MWTLRYSKAAIKAGRKLPKQVRESFEVWVDIVRTQGPAGLRTTNGMNDESLKGDWKGYRSSRLNRQYRVIYRIENDTVCVFVIDITAHDYRKG